MKVYFTCTHNKLKATLRTYSKYFTYLTDKIQSQTRAYTHDSHYLDNLT